MSFRQTNMADRPIRTSETDPLIISDIQTPTGVLGLTLCPGLKSSGPGGDWDRDLSLDIQAIAEWKPDMIVLAMAASPKGEHKITTSLGQISAVILSTADQGWPIPEDTQLFEKATKELLHARRGLIISMYGGERGGTLAVQCLVTSGVPLEDAINRVSRAHSPVITTEIQRRYLKALSERKSKVQDRLVRRLGLDIDDIARGCEVFCSAINSIDTGLYTKSGWYERYQAYLKSLYFTVRLWSKLSGTPSTPDMISKAGHLGTGFEFERLQGQRDQVNQNGEQPFRLLDYYKWILAHGVPCEHKDELKVIQNFFDHLVNFSSEKLLAGEHQDVSVHELTWFMQHRFQKAFREIKSSIQEGGENDEA